MKIGWNYSHLEPNGRNILFFRNTHHDSKRIQATILESLEDNFSLFPVLFTEGYTGKYMLPESAFRHTENELREIIKSTTDQDLDAITTFAYRHHSKIIAGRLTIFGVENNDLYMSGLELIQLIRGFYKKGLGKLSNEEKDLLIRATEFYKRVNERREAYAVDVIDKSLKPSRSAGLIYGDRHFKGITTLLRSVGIGYLSFFPGSQKSTLSEEEKHQQMLLTILESLKQ